MPVPAPLYKTPAPTPRGEQPKTVSLGQLASMRRGGNQATLRMMNSETTAQIAYDGLVGGGSPLTHGARLQRQFGRYDLSSIRSHVGGAAGDATTVLGANGYASGEAVAFKSKPSLGSEAHEVAHVLGQRAGFMPSGAHGEQGDRYEKFAEDVKQTVTAGKSVEPLLDRTLGRRAARSGPRRARAPVQFDIGPGMARALVRPKGGIAQGDFVARIAQSGRKTHYDLAPYRMDGGIFYDVAYNDHHWVVYKAPQQAVPFFKDVSIEKIFEESAKHQPLQQKLKGVSTEEEMDDLYGQADEGDAALRAFIQNMMKSCPGNIRTTSLKERQTAEEKLDRKGIKPSELKDIARATVVYATLSQLEAARDYIMEKDEYVSIADYDNALKDRYKDQQDAKKGKNGKNADDAKPQYLDIKFFLRVGISGGRTHLCELQLNVEPMLKAKKNAHPMYDITRNKTSDATVVLDTAEIRKRGPKLKASYVRLKQGAKLKADQLEQYAAVVHRFFEADNQTPVQGPLVFNADEVELLEDLQADVYGGAMKHMRQKSVVVNGQLVSMAALDK